MINYFNTEKTDKSLDIISKIVTIVVISLILPIIIIPIIKVSGHSEVIEEIAKMLVVLFFILKLPTIKTKIYAGILFGLSFGLSENLFYLSNVFQVGNLGFLIQRFAWTVPMHIVTVLIILFSALNNKKFIILGLILSIIIHVYFNIYVTQMM